MACSQELLELLSCYVDGEATPGEAARAEAHLDTCPECKEIVQEWRHGIEMLDWTYSRALPENVAEPTFDPPMPAPERVRSGWTLALPDMRILAAAAVLAFIALIGSTVYQQFASPPTLGRSLATARTAQTVLVAKGIRLEIEPDSEISRLGDKAIRLVQGTINAEVTHGRGFRILTRKLEIIDLGTRFQVHSDPGTDRVTVKEGRVLVREGKNEYHVGAGESLASTENAGRTSTRLEQNEGSAMQSNHGGWIVAVFPIFGMLVGILVIIFWVRMLINAVTREFAGSSTKIAWVLVILFGHVLGAVIYYCAVYRKDHPRETLRQVLVGRRGDQRVIQWWNVLVSAVLSAAAFSFFSAAIVHEATKTTMFVGAIVGIMFVAACVAQGLLYPLDVLTDLETGKTPSEYEINKRYPFPLLVARRNGKRVIIWWNVMRMARVLYVFIAFSIWIALVAIRGTSQIGPPLYYGLLAVVIIMSVTIGRLLRAPLYKLTDLDKI